jgi:hypothetical protein
MIYIPPTRDGASSVASFLRGRLWRAARWSEPLLDEVAKIAEGLNEKFAAEPAVDFLREILEKRWSQLHTGGTDSNPIFQALGSGLDDFVERAELHFKPTEQGTTRAAAELSDGQRSLLAIALAATALDAEDRLLRETDGQFDLERLRPPTLTVIVVEEPENSLAPFFLSRIVGQMLDISKSERAQVVLSTHAPSALSRVPPESVRHFRLEKSGQSLVSSLALPSDDDDAAKYVQQAVRAYPELYFAKFVVLGEGSSEEIALPILAKAHGFLMDRSFVPVVPLGGRHVNHMWISEFHMQLSLILTWADTAEVPAVSKQPVLSLRQLVAVPLVGMEG